MKEKLSLKSILIALGTGIIFFGVIFLTIRTSKLYSSQKNQQPFVQYIDWRNTLSKQEGFEKAKYWKSQIGDRFFQYKISKDSFNVHTLGGTLQLDGFCFLAYSYFLQNKTDALYLKKKKFPLYIGIPWLQLKNNDDYYFFQNGNHYLVPTVYSKNNLGVLTNTHPQKVKVAFAVKKSFANESSDKLIEKDQILIKMNAGQTTYRFCILLSKILMCICLLSYIILIFYSLLIVWNISKGKAFNAVNIRRLKICLLFSLVPLTIVYLSVAIIYLLVYKNVHSYVSINFSEIYIAKFNFWLPLIFAFVLIAFVKGHKLQQEQEFTI